MTRPNREVTTFEHIGTVRDINSRDDLLFVDIDYEVIRQGMLMVTASGTAVTID